MNPILLAAVCGVIGISAGSIIVWLWAHHQNRKDQRIKYDRQTQEEQ